MTGPRRRRGANELLRGSDCAAGEVVLDYLPPPPTHLRRPSSVVWHDVECGAYSADLALWEELADPCGRADSGAGLRDGPGCAAAGEAWASGYRPRSRRCLAGCFWRAGGWIAGGSGAGRRGAALSSAENSDWRSPRCSSLQLLGGAEERLDCLRCVSSHLRAGGRAALAIVEELPLPEAGGAPRPDVREVDGWVYSSLPIEARVTPIRSSSGACDRPSRRKGALSDEVDEVRLRRLSADDAGARGGRGRA